MRTTRSQFAAVLMIAVSLLFAPIASAATLQITGGTLGTNLLSTGDFCYFDITELSPFSSACRPTAFDPFSLLEGTSGALVLDPAFGDPVTVLFEFTHAPIDWESDLTLDVTQPFVMTGLFINELGEQFDLVGQGSMRAFWEDSNFFTFYTLTSPVVTPEPSSMILLLLAGLVVVGFASAHRRQSGGVL